MFNFFEVPVDQINLGTYQSNNKTLFFYTYISDKKMNFNVQVFCLKPTYLIKKLVQLL